MQLTEKTSVFIERMGLTFEHLGATRIAGRLAGLLLLADKPLSLTDMAGLLKVSKASVSTNTRLLVNIGLGQRVSVPGDRRDYYRIPPDAFQRAIVRRMAVIHELIDLSDEGLQAIDADNDAGRIRLEHMRDFYRFFLNEMDDALLKWRQTHPGNAG